MELEFLLGNALAAKREFALAVVEYTDQLEARSTKERAPTRMAGFWWGKFYLENYDVL